MSREPDLFLARGLVVEVWLQQNNSTAKFSRETELQLLPGVVITRVKPIQQQECTMTVWEMPFCSPDSLVEEMVELYGGKLLSPPGNNAKVQTGALPGHIQWHPNIQG